MSSYYRLLTIGVLLLANLNHAVSMDKTISKEMLKAHVAYLSSDRLNGRLTGSEGEKYATEYAAQIFKRLGLEPAGDNHTYFQNFEFTTDVMLGKEHSPLRPKKQNARNVLAKLKVTNGNSALVVIGAHIDHLGKGDHHSIYSGADDNASGVACVLEAAAKLSYLKSQGKLVGNKDILFALWSGEELGLLGSSYFIKQIPKSGKRAVDAYVNLDMVGHFRDKFVVQSVGSSIDWKKIFEKVNHNHSFSIIFQNDPYLPTDSTAFYLQNIPTLNLFTGAHEAYHTPRDKMSLINFTGMQNITEFLVELVIALEKKEHFITYQTLPNAHNHTVRGFKIYLGTIPDYASEIATGVKLSGVIKDSPAEKAGLKQEDVIIQLANKNITDIYDYMAVLNSLTVARPVRIVVKRGGIKTYRTIVPLSRH